MDATGTIGDIDFNEDLTYCDREIKSKGRDWQVYEYMSAPRSCVISAFQNCGLRPCCPQAPRTFSETVVECIKSPAIVPFVTIPTIVPRSVSGTCLCRFLSPSLPLFSSFQDLRDQFSMFCPCASLWHLWFLWISSGCSLVLFTLTFALTLGP